MHRAYREVAIWLLYLAIVLVALLCFFRFVDYCSSAPAPVQRPARKAPCDRVAGLANQDLVGRWSLIWCGRAWELELSAFGTYRCWLAGSESEWVGTWFLDSLGRLIIAEQCVGPQGVGSPSSWYVKWDRDRAGKVARLAPAGRAYWASDDREAAIIRMERKK